MFVASIVYSSRTYYRKKRPEIQTQIISLVLIYILLLLKGKFICVKPYYITSSTSIAYIKWKLYYIVHVTYINVLVLVLG